MEFINTWKKNKSNSTPPNIKQFDNCERLGGVCYLEKLLKLKV